MKQIVQLPEVYWHSLPNKLFGRTPNPMMLNEGGILYPAKISQSRSKIVEYANVRFDKAYVVAFIKNKVTDPLAGIPREDLQKLFDEALGEE